MITVSFCITRNAANNRYVDIDRIGPELKTERLAAQITAETIHEHSGLGLNTIERLESGRGNPNLATLRRYIAALQNAEFTR